MPFLYFVPPYSFWYSLYATRLPSTNINDNSMTDTYVQSFTHLAGRPKSDQALPLLKRIASLVKPIMRKHGWVLPVLAEFFPESPNLVGEPNVHFARFEGLLGSHQNFISRPK